MIKIRKKSTDCAQPITTAAEGQIDTCISCTGY